MSEDRLTNRDFEEEFCLECDYHGEPNGCNFPNGTCNKYDFYMEVWDKLAEYEDLGTPSELAKLVKARKEGRILPEGFSCIELSDEKTLAVFYPDGKCVASEPRQYFTVSERREAL